MLKQCGVCHVSQSVDPHQPPVTQRPSGYTEAGGPGCVQRDLGSHGVQGMGMGRWGAPPSQNSPETSRPPGRGERSVAREEEERA